MRRASQADAVLTRGWDPKCVSETVRTEILTYHDLFNLTIKLRLEVNIGIIAACTPIMKPFIRYIQARVSGNDPHGLVRRRSSSQWGWHSHWYSRPWGSRPSVPAADSRNNIDSASSPSHPFTGHHIQRRHPYPVGVRLPHYGDVTDKTASLELPLQGTAVMDGIREDIPGFRPVDSRALQTGLGQPWDIHDYV